MATDPLDPNPALRAELLKALAVIQDQVNGLSNFAKFEAISEVLGAIRAQIDARSRRMNLIQAEIDSLDAVIAARMALAEDGYPSLPGAQVTGEVLHEIQNQMAEIDIAAKIFGSSATAISLDIPGAVLTNQPEPVRRG